MKLLATNTGNKNKQRHSIQIRTETNAQMNRKHETTQTRPNKHLWKAIEVHHKNPHGSRHFPQAFKLNNCGTPEWSKPRKVRDGKTLQGFRSEKGNTVRLGSEKAKEQLKARPPTHSVMKWLAGLDTYPRVSVLIPTGKSAHSSLYCAYPVVTLPFRTGRYMDTWKTPEKVTGNPVSLSD